MEVPGRTRRSQRENVVPLINVVFLLLIFFMLAGTLRRPDPLGVEPPESTVSTPEVGTPRSVSLGPGGEIAVDGKRVDLAELPQAVSTPVREAATPETPTWVLRADATAGASELIPVLRALQEAGLDRVALAVRPQADR